MKKAIAMAVAIAATGSANAAWQTGNGTDGELILTVWNDAAERAISVDLGVLTREAMTGTLAAQTFDLNTADIDWLGGVGSDVSWNVAGANNSYVTATEDWGWYFTGTVAPITALPRNQTIGFFSVLDSYGALVNSTTGENPVHRSEGDGAHAGEGNIWGDRLAGVTPNYNSSSTVGSDLDSLNAFALNERYDGGFIAQIVTDENLWTLDLASATLTYGAATAPEVPVPAAAWLFGSALIGLAGIGRKRNAK